MKFAVVIAPLCVTSTSAFVPLRVSNTFGSSSSSSRIYAGDGNPPPFGSWGQPAAPAPAPAPANPYADWGQPAASASTPAPAAYAPPPVAPAPAPPAAAAAPAPPAAVGGDPISTLDTAQVASVNQIASSIPDLMAKTDLSWGAADGVTIGGSPATLDARDAPGPANVAWLASVCIPSKLSSLTIFNGPLTDVPHLLSRCCILDGGNTLSFALDFRPRAYGAYELPDSERGPDKLGRKAFEYSGARNDFDNKFGTEDVVAFLSEATASFQGATPNTVSELDLLTGGPLAISVTMPVNDVNIAAVAAVREKAAAAWLRWALEDEHGHRPGAPINTQYVYDSKFRQNAYSALLPFYSSVFGAEDGAKLAAAESGPLDEGYVGGGS